MALDQLAVVATQMSAQPGVFAVLLGSGVSTGAGIPTGWGVQKDLVTRVAAAQGVTLDPADDAGVEDWWRQETGTEVGYSPVLERLGSTPATRQGLLEGYFTPPAGDQDPQGSRQPTPAHHAIAAMMNRGLIRVILTTNFDRLMEQALDQAGVAHTVVDSVDALEGMQPLTHQQALLVKIHGDYRSLLTRNTTDELSNYPPQWEDFLGQIVDQFGLIISGWSADWDTNLASIIERSPSRRYPLFWDTRSSAGDTARRLLAARDGHALPAGSADDLFTRLNEATLAIDRIGQSPLTDAMALAILKRHLLNPVRRLDVYDTVMSRLPHLTTVIRAHDHTSITTPQAQAEVLDAYRDATTPLLHLIAHGVRHDTGPHDQLWADVLDHLLALPRLVPPTNEPGTNRVIYAQRYPALLALTVAGTAALRAGREQFLHNLCSLIRRDPIARQDSRLLDLLRPQDVTPLLDLGPNDGPGQRPWTDRLRADVTPTLTDLLPPTQTDDLLDDLEIRLVLLTRERPWGSSYLTHYLNDAAPPAVMRRLETAAKAAGPDWPWWNIDAGSSGLLIELMLDDAERAYRQHSLR